jgi:hypothetical protein
VRRGRHARAPGLAAGTSHRDQRPAIEIEQPIAMIAPRVVAPHPGGAPGRHQPQPQRATPGAATRALSRTSDQSRPVSRAKQGLAWVPALIGTIGWAWASP